MKTSIDFRPLQLFAFTLLILVAISCDDDDNSQEEMMTIRYEQEDQFGRPAINTVFVSAEEKDKFNTTIPSMQGAAFAAKFKEKLMALNPNYTTNLLGLDAETFTNVLATDVLSVSLDGPTTFYDGTNVLTGRKLEDDVITVELILLFGGPDAVSNPGLTDDNVGSNDKEFKTTFPYLADPH
jgi:hypothetical protein